MTDAMQALYDGDAEKARALLPPDDELDIFHAAAFGRIERLRELLDDANAFSEDGFTPLHLAAYAEQAEAARLLIDAGADVNAFSTAPIAQVTPLGTAAFVGSAPLARLLLDAGSDPDLVSISLPL
jgi:ankyrin repeat protein